VVRCHSSDCPDTERIENPVIHHGDKGPRFAVKQQKRARVWRISEHPHAAQQPIAGQQADADAFELAWAPVDDTALAHFTAMLSDHRRLDCRERAPHLGRFVP
jgi:hypothetical protein